PAVVEVAPQDRRLRGHGPVDAADEWPAERVVAADGAGVESPAAEDRSAAPRRPVGSVAGEEAVEGHESLCGECAAASSGRMIPEEPAALEEETHLVLRPVVRGAPRRGAVADEDAVRERVERVLSGVDRASGEAGLVVLERAAGDREGGRELRGEPRPSAGRVLRVPAPQRE